ncbi:MAG: alpha-galactosidase, partial [Treponemataceae bacterium]|nr:alpha-galactosidase [Treponemataceae bacterium]
RFDPGMLYYSPQIWTSDNTDAISRLSIQEGTAMVFPLSSLGAHVSVCPNHIMGRNTPLETRGAVALAGTFGYELDLFKLTPEERKAVPEQIKTYHRFGALIRSGDYYRLKSYSENKDWDSWEIVSKDKKEALVTVIQVLGKPNARSRKLVLEGLNPKANYKITSLIETKSTEINEFEKRIFSGDLLMSAGILIPSLWGDFNSSMYYLEEV